MKLLARQQEKFEIKLTCQHNAERKNILMLNRVFQGFRLKPMHILGKLRIWVATCYFCDTLATVKIYQYFWRSLLREVGVVTFTT